MMNPNDRILVESTAKTHPFRMPVLTRCWSFLPVLDPTLERCVRLSDEKLLPSTSDPAVAQYLVRRCHGNVGVEIFVRGRVIDPPCRPVALDGWHRAVPRCEAYVVRQGAWVFVPDPTFQVAGHSWLYDEPLPGGEESLHLAEWMVRRIDGDEIHVKGRVRHLDHPDIELHGWHRAVPYEEER